MNTYRERGLPLRITTALCLSLFTLSAGCDEAQTEPSSELRADCPSYPTNYDPVTAIMVNSDVFDSIEATVDAGNSITGPFGSASAALDEDDTEFRTGAVDDDICDDPEFAEDPSRPSYRCASNLGGLRTLLETEALQVDGAQCVVLAALEDNGFIIEGDTGAPVFDEGGTGNDFKYRFSGQGAAFSFLVTGDGTTDTQLHNVSQLGDLDSKATIRAMNYCYDDRGHRVVDGPSAEVFFEGEFRSKLTTANTRWGATGNSMAKGEYTLGMKYLQKSKNDQGWQVLGGEPKGLSQTRASKAKFNIEFLRAALILVEEWASRYFFGSVWEPKTADWSKKIDEANKVVWEAVDPANSRRLIIYEEKDIGKVTDTMEKRENKTVTLAPFDVVTFEMNARLDAQVTVNSGLFGFGAIGTVAAVSDYSLFLNMEYPISECQKITDSAFKQVCLDFKPVGYYSVGARDAANMPGSWDAHYSRYEPSVLFFQDREDLYSERTFPFLATQGEETFKNWGWHGSTAQAALNRMKQEIRGHLPVASAVDGVVSQVEGPARSVD